MMNYSLLLSWKCFQHFNSSLTHGDMSSSKSKETISDKSPNYSSSVLAHSFVPNINECEQGPPSS